jgi:multiple sugar transport system permease protein
MVNQPHSISEQPQDRTGPGAQSSRRRRSRSPADRAKLWFILPAVLWIVAFTIFPLLFSIYISLFAVRPGRPWRFVGLGNFGRLFTDENLRNALTITLIFVAATVMIEMLLGFALALLFNREMRGRQFFRALMTLPLFATPVAIGYLGITLFYEEGGPINSVFNALLGINPPWLSNGQWALAAMIIIDIWQWTPFVFLVALAGLQSLPHEIYEASAVDGATPRQMFRFLTLPLMVPTLTIILLLRLVEAFKIFDIPTSLTLGGPGRSTEVYSLFTYRTALRFFDLGYASAQGFLLLFIVMLIVSLLFGRIRRAYA